MLKIDGKKAAADLRADLKKKVAELKSTYNAVPGLTVILVGEDAPSQIYVKNKEKSANEVGIKSEVVRYPEKVEEKVVLDKIKELNDNNEVSGILVQLPLPKHIDKRKVIETINPGKDVDGFHPMNVGNLSSGYESSIPEISLLSLSSLILSKTTFSSTFSGYLITSELIPTSFADFSLFFT